MRIFVIISHENRFMWPTAYTTQREAELICEFLDKRFELSGPYYVMELSVRLEDVKNALEQKDSKAQSGGDVQAAEVAAGRK